MEKVSGRDRERKHIMVGKQESVRVHEQEKEKQEQRGEGKEGKAEKEKAQRERVKMGDEEKTTIFWLTKIWTGKKL